MNRTKVITGILLILILGAFSGALGTGVYMENRIKHLLDPKGPPPPVHLLNRRLDRLDLSAEQRARLDAKLQRMQVEFRAVIQEVKPDLDHLFDRHMESLRAELTPDQRAPFDETIARIKDRMKQMGASPPSPDRPAAGPSALPATLGLTDEQARRSEHLMAAMARDKDAIRQRFELERERLREEMAADLEKLMEKTTRELAGFLSPEQVEGMRQAYAPMGGAP